VRPRHALSDSISATSSQHQHLYNLVSQYPRRSLRRDSTVYRCIRYVSGRPWEGSSGKLRCRNFLPHGQGRAEYASSGLLNGIDAVPRMACFYDTCDGHAKHFDLVNKPLPLGCHESTFISRSPRIS